jgi:DNA-directed RNA polymerase specialized sigma24 family protein
MAQTELQSIAVKIAKHEGSLRELRARQRELIRERLAEGMSYTAIQAEAKVSRPTVAAARKG